MTKIACDVLMIIRSTSKDLYLVIQAENINVYGAFLHNYGRATDAVRRRCGSSQRFADLTREIACRGQPVSLDDLLHKPVARVQKNALVLHVSRGG